LREKLASLERARVALATQPAFGDSPAEKSSSSLFKDDDARAVGRGQKPSKDKAQAARGALDSRDALQTEKHMILPEKIRTSDGMRRRLLRGITEDFKDRSSGLATDDSLETESVSELGNHMLNAALEGSTLQSPIKIRINNQATTDIFVAASRSFDRGWTNSSKPGPPALLRIDMSKVDDIQVPFNLEKRYDHDSQRAGSSQFGSSNYNYKSDVDRDSASNTNASNLGRRGDAADAQAFRKNKSNQEDQKQLVNEISASLIQKLKDIKQKRQYITRTASIEHMEHNQPAFAFFTECRQQHELDVPVFQGLIDQALFVQGQHLGPGHCAALCNGFRVIQERSLPLSHVILHNNNLSDQNQAALIEGLNQVKRLKRYESVGNQFKDECVDRLALILTRPAPYQLRELKLSGCKLAARCTESLLKILAKRCVLEQLCLQRAHYNRSAVGYLCDIIDHARLLTTIDISWCSIPKQGMSKHQPGDYFVQILGSLSQNRKLVHINISWNNFCGAAPHPTMSLLPAPGEKPKENKPNAPGAPAEDKDNKDKDKKDGLQSKQELVAGLIAKIIKYNKKIMHLNLENTGLTLAMVEVIYPALRKAMSLQSLHLSNNPWLLKLDNAEGDKFREVTEAVVRMHKKIRARVNKRPYVTAGNRPDRKLMLPATNYELIRLGQIHQKYAYLKSLSHLDLHVDAFWQNKFIVQRRLGHKLDMPGSGQWEIVSDITKHLDGDENILKKEKKKDKAKENAKIGQNEEEAQENEEQPEGEQQEEEPYEGDLRKLTVSSPQECCWVCSRQRYVLLFWSRKIAQKVR